MRNDSQRRARAGDGWERAGRAAAVRGSGVAGRGLGAAGARDGGRDSPAFSPKLWLTHVKTRRLPFRLHAFPPLRLPPLHDLHDGPAPRRMQRAPTMVTDESATKKAVARPAKVWRRAFDRLRSTVSVVFNHATKHTGVGIICAVAYFDPYGVLALTCVFATHCVRRTEETGESISNQGRSLATSSCSSSSSQA